MSNPEQDVLEFLTDFNERVHSLRVPLVGSLEVTNRCNLRCVHCYMGDLRQGKANAEMNTAKILSVMDEAVEAGCLYLTITGGEPLIREDFPVIYSHARKSGLVVTVFTNGTLISEKVLDLFQELPPRGVEISLYGASADVYERITRIAGSHRRCMEGIERLLGRGIRVGLKTMLMTINSDELSEMERIAKDLGVSFRFDAGINPRLDGDISPLSLRVPPEEVVEKEISDEKRAKKWAKFLEENQRLLSKDDLYDCGAGTMSFNVASSARLQPCMMTPHISYDLYQGSFEEGWNIVSRDIRKRKRREDDRSLCMECTKSSVCGYCPGSFKMETGFEDVPSPYLCALGHSRFKHLSRKG